MDRVMHSYDGNSGKNKPIGTATISQRSTIDLTKEIPEVTDVTFAQEFTADKISFESQTAAAPANQQPVIIQA